MVGKHRPHLTNHVFVRHIRGRQIQLLFRRARKEIQLGKERVNNCGAAVAERLHEKQHFEEVCGRMRLIFAEEGLEADVGVSRQCFEVPDQMLQKYSEGRRRRT